MAQHIAGAQRFMPGTRMQRESAVRHCQGTVLADYIARSTDGRQIANGTNVFVLGADGRLEAVTGFMAATVGGKDPA